MNTTEQTAKKAIKLFTLLLFFASCSQVKTLTPSSRFITPESGEDLGHGNFQLFYQTGTRATLNATETDFEKPMNLDDGVNFSFATDINIHKKISLIYYSNGMDSAPLFGAKYQLLGPTKSKAKKGDHSLSITLGGGAAGEVRKTSDNSGDDFFDSLDVDQININRNLLDLSIIHGKRLTDRVLWYSSIHLNQHKLHVSIEDDSSSLNGESVDYQTTNLGLASGLMIYDKKGKYHFALEASFQKTKWTKNDETQRGFINGAVGYNW